MAVLRVYLGRGRLFALSALLMLMWTVAYIELGEDVQEYHQESKCLLGPELCHDEGVMNKHLKGDLQYDNSQLLDVIKDKFLTPPSKEPYNLMEDVDPNSDYLDYKRIGFFFLARSVVQHYFKDVMNGVFVEAGALDGEYLSNTLRLEKDQGWTGLLVEPDPFMFKHVLNKKRKAWAANCCLATQPFPHKSVLATPTETFSSAIKSTWSLVSRGKSSLIEISSDDNSVPLGVFEEVQCLPFASLLLALHITKVDYISLDVEGAEISIIDQFPFDRITVDVWYIEHRRLNQTRQNKQLPDAEFVTKFTSRGYVSHFLLEDYVFVREGSPYNTTSYPAKSVTSQNYFRRGKKNRT